MRTPRAEVRGRTRRGGPWVVYGILAVALALIGVGATGWALAAAAPARTVVRDLAGHQVAIEPEVTPNAATTKKMDVTNDSGVRLTVPEAGLDVPLAAMNEVDGTITPPGFQDAYWIRNIGASPEHSEAGTVYIAMHSIRGGGVGPGNYLIDIAHGTSRLPVGTAIEVAGTRYLVSGARTIAKHDLPASKDVWANTPGRLVLITCLQRPDGRPSTSNMVITATRASE